MGENIDNIKWNSSLTFFMATMGAVIGLGNIWRFSYLLYSNGGGAFFIPYMIAIFIMGIPFLILEYGLGAKFKDSFSNILKSINSSLEIIGWLTAFLIFLVATYYIVLVGWDFIYLILSFFKGWTSNPNNFFMNNIVVGTNDLNGLTTFVIPTFLVTLFIWIIAWFISHKSLNDGISKVVNILMPLLFVMIFIIVIYALTLPGMDLGLKELFNPNWTLLSDIHVWLAALGQTVFSLSIGQAIIVTYASYLPEKTKLLDNVFMVVIANTLFEIIMAVGVFSILGFMVYNSGIPLNEIATSGTGLVFIVFPEIFSQMGIVSYIIGPLFFASVLFAGITSIIAFIEPLSLNFSKKFKFSRKKSTTIICIFGFLLSIIFTTGSGNYILSVVDSFLNDFAIILVIIIQAIVFAWIFDIKELLPVLNKYYTYIKVGTIWVNIMKYVLPIFLSILLIFGIINLFNTQSQSDIIIEIILSLLIIIVPVVLTVLPFKE